MTLTLSSPAFALNEEIPVEYTCEGQDISPPLNWQGVPDGTRSLVLVIDDPDAPDPTAPKMTWVHWILFNLPPTTVGLPAGTTAENLPAGTQAGFNDFKRTTYGGPCPPVGRHRYFHKLYALDTMLAGLDSPTKPQIEAAMTGHILAQAELVGTYQKHGRRR
ncbi:MAG: YbhB/YbcL family Raf kinase inhibitor-like protein [Cyanobacteria bacterium J06648_16]